MPEGRVGESGRTLTYEFFLADHRGNAPVSFERQLIAGACFLYISSLKKRTGPGAGFFIFLRVVQRGAKGIAQALLANSPSMI
jgi:hypothetical protein